MLTTDQKRRIVLALEKGENPEDFLLNNPVETEDLDEYYQFWHAVAQEVRIRPTPTQPREEVSFSNDIGYADGVRFTSAP